MSINPKQLEAFVAVADQGSFSRAADRLNTTQPNISARIAALEERLGVVLMQRDAGSVRLTDAGVATLAHARRVLASIDDFIAAADDPTLVRGTIRLGVTELVVYTFLGDFLSTLSARFPNIVTDVTVDMSAQLSRALLNRSLDLTLQSGPFDDAVSGEIPLGRFSYQWVAAPALGLAGRPLTREDILQCPVVTHARGTRAYEQMVAHLGPHRVSGPRILRSTHLLACLQMAIEGLGVACVPAALARDAIAEGRLSTADYDWLPDELAFAARYDAGTARSTVVEAAAIAASVAARHAEA